MKKRLLTLSLALALCLGLALPVPASASTTTFSNGITLSDPSKHMALAHLPATLQRPAYPNTVGQTDPLMTRFYDFAGKEKNWPYPQSMESVFQEIVALTDSLTAGKTTDTQKAKAIFDWVAQNIEYGVLADEYDEGYYLKLDIYADPLQVYIRRHARCEGYALLSQFMCTIAGIPTAYIAGFAQDGGLLHAWNAVLTDGRWVFFDATWNEWDMAPDYHSTTEQIAYYDGVFLIDISKGVSGHDVRMHLRTGFLCPDSVTVPDGVTWVDLQNHPNLTGITLPDSVTYVYFAGCTGLTDVTLPASIVQMNFSGCTDLKSVNIPNSVTAIGNSAFYRCTSLKSITIPNSVTSIDHMAFSDSGLRSITIPGSVTSMGDGGTFYGCTALEDVTIQEGVAEIGDSSFMGCTALKTVTIPGSVKVIKRQAFMECTALETVNIAEGVTSIEKLAFFGCANLRRADLPDSLTSLGGEAFAGCPKLESLSLPASMTSIGVGAYQARNDIESFVIPDHVTVIGERAFYDCKNLKSVTIPNSVTTINYAAFRGCSSLESVTIPNSVTTIGNEVFSGCDGMTSLTIPEGVVSIGNRATNWTMESLTLPVSLTSIGDYNVSSGMKDIYYAGTEEQWNAISFGKQFGLEQVTVHYNSAVPKPAEPEKPAHIAYASTQSVEVDGRKVEFQMYALKDANGNDTNYIKLRDLAYILNGTPAQFEVGWNGAINIEPGKSYTTNGGEMSTPYSGDRACETASAVTNVNGAPADLEAIMLKDDQGGGYTYYKLRDLGTAIGFKVDWSAERGIYIETK